MARLCRFSVCISNGSGTTTPERCRPFAILSWELHRRHPEETHRELPTKNSIRTAADVFRALACPGFVFPIFQTNIDGNLFVRKFRWFMIRTQRVFSLFGRKFLSFSSWDRSALARCNWLYSFRSKCRADAIRQLNAYQYWLNIVVSCWCIQIPIIGQLDIHN